MSSSLNRTVVGLFAFMMLVTMAAAAYLQQLYLLLIPAGLLLIYFLLQFPVLLFYTLLASIPWSMEYNFSQSLGTDLPDEPLMLITSLAVIIMLVYGYKSGKLFLKMPRAINNSYDEQLSGKKYFHPVLFLVVLQLLWTVITVITSTDTIVSVKYLLAKCWYLLAFAGAPLILIKDRAVLKRSALVLLSSMMLCMLLALVRHGQNGWTFEKINDSLEPFFRNHVTYSALLVFMVPIQIAVIRLSLSKKIRIIAGVILVITIGALYFSYARGAWLALFTGLASLWLLRKKLLLPAFISIIFLCLGALLWLKKEDRFINYASDYKSTIFHKDFREHLIATYEMKDVSTAERFYRWVAGIRMIDESWKTGFGPSAFYGNYKSYTLPAFKTWVSNNPEHSTVHNYFLLLIIEQGLPGLLLFLLLLGLLFWYAEVIYHRTTDKFWKVVVSATSAILVMECTVNFLSDMIETDKVGSVFYLCLSVIVIADVNTRMSDSPSYIQRIS